MKQEQKPKLIKTQNGEAINCRWKCVGEKLEAYGSTPESAYDMYQSLMYYIAHINVPEGERLRIGREVYDSNYAEKYYLSPCHVGADWLTKYWLEGHNMFAPESVCINPLAQQEKEWCGKHGGNTRN